MCVDEFGGPEQDREIVETSRDQNGLMPKCLVTLVYKPPTPGSQEQSRTYCSSMSKEASRFHFSSFKVHVIRIHKLRSTLLCYCCVSAQIYLSTKHVEHCTCYIYKLLHVLYMHSCAYVALWYSTMIGKQKPCIIFIFKFSIQGDHFAKNIFKSVVLRFCNFRLENEFRTNINPRTKYLCFH